MLIVKLKEKVNMKLDKLTVFKEKSFRVVNI